MRQKLKLQEIFDGSTVEVSFDGIILYKGVPLSLMEAIKLLRNEYPILDMRSAKGLWEQREFLNLKYD